MLDGERKVLYVGKARNLRKRLSSYFQKIPDSLRTQAMVQQIRDLNFTVTSSEAEALVLEHNLIKQLKPRYNVLMKDSKSYPYILLSDENYPKLHIYRGKRTLAGEYFGPFPNAGAVHATLHVMQSIFRIRDCENGVWCQPIRNFFIRPGGNDNLTLVVCAIFRRDPDSEPAGIDFIEVYRGHADLFIVDEH